MSGADSAMSGADAARPVRPLDAAERRVLGTLIEKGKTTPDQYPLSLNALVNGCNQKSNRDPVTSLDEEQVTRALAGLRQCGAIAEVYGNGKIARYRHLAYEWLGASKEELAILGELLLRGAQTEGDLRGRASRMDEIPDLDVLRRHLDRLAERGLVVEGRHDLDDGGPQHPVGLAVEHGPGGDAHDDERRQRGHEHDRRVPEREPDAEARPPGAVTPPPAHSHGPGRCG